MICEPCRSGASYLKDIKRPAEDRDSLARSEHNRCRERARQQAGNLTAVELAGSPWCDCQHIVPVRGRALAPTLK